MELCDHSEVRAGLLVPRDQHLDFGFGECMDSFLGFRAFKTARQSEFLPESMFEIFDVPMHEETRHIVFFINYMAWREVQRGRGAAPLRADIGLVLIAGRSSVCWA